MSEILSFLVPSIIGLLSAWFGARWAVRGALEERWWDRKFHAYTEIIEALHHLVWYSEALKNSYEMLEHATKIPKEAERRECYFDAQLKIRKATDIGPFIISEDTSRILRILRKQTECDDSEAPREVVLDFHCKSYREALQDIRTCASQDLQRNWGWR